MSGGVRVYGPVTAQQDLSTGSRNIYISAVAPANTQGQDGDVWLQYTP